MSAQHTPGPWHAREWNTRAATTVAVLDPQANVTGVRVIAECDTAEDAARIVQCVNARGELVAAAQAAIKKISGGPQDRHEFDVLDMLRAAIAKAGVQP